VSWTGGTSSTLDCANDLRGLEHLYRIPYGSTPRRRCHWGGSHGSDLSAL